MHTEVRLKTLAAALAIVGGPDAWIPAARAQEYSPDNTVGNRRERTQTYPKNTSGKEKHRAVFAALALSATVLLASVAAAQVPVARRTYTVIGFRDCELVVGGARALGMTVARTDDTGSCVLTVTGPLPIMRAIDATVEDVTDSGGCAAAE